MSEDIEETQASPVIKYPIGDKVIIRALSAAGLTIEADWNTDMSKAPRDEPILLGRASKNVPHVSQAIWLDGKWMSFRFPSDDAGLSEFVAPTAWKPLNPPGDG